MWLCGRGGDESDLLSVGPLQFELGGGKPAGGIPVRRSR